MRRIFTCNRHAHRNGYLTSKVCLCNHQLRLQATLNWFFLLVRIVCTECTFCTLLPGYRYSIEHEGPGRPAAARAHANATEREGRVVQHCAGAKETKTSASYGDHEPGSTKLAAIAIAMRGLPVPFLLGVMLGCLVPRVTSKIVAVWIDVEDHEAIIDGRNASVDKGWLQNATNIAHSANLRFAADAQVGWAFAGNSADPTRPVHQQVMDIVDEVTLMDYFTSCSSSGDCDPTQAMYLAAPWISYASFLHTTRNRSVRAPRKHRAAAVYHSQNRRWCSRCNSCSEQVLLDIGIALGSSAGRIQTELELEQVGSNMHWTGIPIPLVCLYESEQSRWRAVSAGLGPTQRGAGRQSAAQLCSFREQWLRSHVSIRTMPAHKRKAVRPPELPSHARNLVVRAAAPARLRSSARSQHGLERLDPGPHHQVVPGTARHRALH